MDFTLNIRPSRIARYLALSAMGFLIAGAVSHSIEHGFNLTSDLHRWFNVDGEKNFPAAFSSGLFLVASAITAVIAACKLKSKDEFTLYWIGLSCLFSALALDEWLSFHEQLSGVILSVLPAAGVFHFAWILAGVAFIAILGLTYSRFMFHLPPQYRYGFIIAAITFVTGAIGMEVISGYYVDTHQQWSRTIWLGLTTVEEGLEMLGLIVCINTLLNYIQEFVGEVTICLRPSHQTRKRPSFQDSSHEY